MTEQFQPADDTRPASEWVKYLRRIVDRPGWSVARLSRETAGPDGKPRVSKSTLFRHLGGEVTRISAALVKLIAEAAGDEPENALRAAGDLLSDEDADDDRLHGLDPKDPIVKAILTGPFDDEFRDRLLRAEVTRRQQRMDEIQMAADLYRRRDEEDQGGDGVD